MPVEIPSWSSAQSTIVRRARRPATLKLCLKVRNQPMLARAWIEHHAAIVGLENLLIADNNSTDEESARLYAEYGGEVTIFRFGESHDRIHWHPEFEPLFQAIRESCDFFSVIDADERLVLCTEETWCADRRILAVLDAAEADTIIPTTWLANQVNRHDAFQLAPGECYGGLAHGLTWGKPILPARLTGVQTGIHNIQFKGFDFNRACQPGLLLLHLCNFPSQRIAANKQKLIGRGIIDESWTTEQILAADFVEHSEPTQNYLRFVHEIRTMQTHLLGTAPPACLHSLSLHDNGTLTYSNDSARMMVANYLHDWSRLAASLFVVTPHNRRNFLEFAPKPEEIVEIATRFRGNEQEGIAQRLLRRGGILYPDHFPEAAAVSPITHPRSRP